jgi:hypothetical protein
MNRTRGGAAQLRRPGQSRCDCLKNLAVLCFNLRTIQKQHTQRCVVFVPLRRLERRHLPPEGSALSTELQGPFCTHSNASLTELQVRTTTRLSLSLTCSGYIESSEGRGIIGSGENFSQYLDIKLKPSPMISMRALVGAAGFEPATSRTRTVRSTGLSHAPNLTHTLPLGGGSVNNSYQSRRVYLSKQVLWRFKLIYLDSGSLFPRGRSQTTKYFWEFFFWNCYVFRKIAIQTNGRPKAS